MAATVQINTVQTISTIAYASFIIQMYNVAPKPPNKNRGLFLNGSRQASKPIQAIMFCHDLFNN